MGILSHDDWSLDRRGKRAEERHQEKVRQAIRDNLGDLIRDEGIILSDGKHTVRVPIKSLEQPHFVFDDGKSGRIGQGQGEPGTVIGQATPSSGSGREAGAGDQPGDLGFDAEVSEAEIADILFESLRLPNLKSKSEPRLAMEDIEFTDVRKVGMRANLDRRRTLLTALMRSERDGKALAITPDDLRFKTWEEREQQQAAAVVIAMMDVSGSMGVTEKYIARTFFHWMERFLHLHYKEVQMRYLVHHTQAYETSREAFYTIKESGGTICSTVFLAALDVIRSDYPVERFNIYPMYVGDGDNMFADGPSSLSAMRRLCDVSAMAGYLEVNPFHRATSLSRALSGLSAETFRRAVVYQPSEILSALETFFSDEGQDNVLQQGVQ